MSPCFNQEPKTIGERSVGDGTRTGRGNWSGRDRNILAGQGRPSADWTQSGCLEWVQLKPRGGQEIRKMEEFH